MKKFCTKVLACAIGTSLLFSSPVYAATAQWDSTAVYTGGNQVTYGGKTYEAQWWTQGEKPGSSQWGAWKLVDGEVTVPTDPIEPTETIDPTDPVESTGTVESTETTEPEQPGKDIPAWEATKAYTGGSQVTYGGKVYQAQWWTQGEQPGSNEWGAWKLVSDVTEPTEPTETVEPTEPTETVEPTEPTETVEPTEPTETVEPTEPTETVEPTEPTETVEPTEPTETVEPTEPTDPSKTEPPHPFWQDYKNYSVKDTLVYYKGKIYSNKWYANAGVKPDSGDPWVLVGDAEWTVPEDEKNYQKDENAASNEINKILSDAEIESLYGGINPEYSPEAALGRLEELIPKSAYEELFPYRFGSDGWKSCPATKMYYPNADEMPDYYSYENLQEALHTLANTIIKVQWYEGAEWCYRIIRLDKTTKEQKLVYCDPSFGEEWLETGKTLCTSVCDYGSFLAEGDLNTRKRELAGFLANISHETGGGTVDGMVDESLTGLYFNEEVGFIGSSAIGYVQGSGTSYLPVAGKSYHGRGPIQLSYNYNYGLCSEVLFGDSSILLNDPDKLEQDGTLGFMTGIWFWMTPQPPKPSCHQVITGVWEPKKGAANEEYNGNFGLTIIIINNEAGQSENGTGAVARRARYYRIFADKMGADITGEHCDTVGMTTFVQQAGQ